MKRSHIDIDGETERMARIFAVEAAGEADWLAVASGADPATCRTMAAVALERAAMRLRLPK